jgi:hypothetical protein
MGMEVGPGKRIRVKNEVRYLWSEVGKDPRSLRLLSIHFLGRSSFRWRTVANEKLPVLRTTSFLTQGASMRLLIHEVVTVFFLATGRQEKFL